MTRIVLIGEELRFRSFNGANKALPVLASSLASAGFHDVVQLDLERADVSRERVAAAARGADLVAIAGAMSPQWPELDVTLSVIGRGLADLERPPPVIVGGYAVKSAEDVLRAQPAISAFFDGEGEVGMVQIAEAVARGDYAAAQGTIPGLGYLEPSGAYRHTVARRVTDFDHIDQNYGLEHIAGRHDMDIFKRPDRSLKTAQLFTQRGCPWACGFCNKSLEDGRVSRLSEASLRRQLRDLSGRGYTSAYLDVDTFTVNVRAALKEARILHEEGFVWGSNTRIDCIDVDLMREFVRLGCVYMFCGVEHIDPGVCLAVEKFNGSLASRRAQADAYRGQVLAVYRAMAVAALPSSFFMILGLPKLVSGGEGGRPPVYAPSTYEDDLACVRFGIQDCDPEYFNFNLLRFMPGSAAADAGPNSPYECVRPSGAAPITGGYFLPRVREANGYRTSEHHGVYRLCESVGLNQPTSRGVDPQRVYDTLAAAVDLINTKIDAGGRATRLFIEEEILAEGLVAVDSDGRYRLAPLEAFEGLPA